MDTLIVDIIKGEEHFIYLYNKDTKAETLRQLGKHASNPKLSITWYDVAILSRQVRSNDAKIWRKTWGELIGGRRY